MLIIARRRGERIFIGDGIEVVVTEVSKHGVRLGIQAPRDLQIVRGEVREAVEIANAAAAELSLDAADQLLTGERQTTDAEAPPERD